MTETSAYSLRKRSGLKRTSSFDTDGDETDDDMKSKQSIEDQSKKPFDFQRHFCRGMTTLVLVAIMVGVFQSGHFYCILVVNNYHIIYHILLYQV